MSTTEGLTAAEAMNELAAQHTEDLTDQENPEPEIEGDALDVSEEAEPPTEPDTGTPEADIAAPNSMTAEEQDAFRTLPPDQQRFISRREGDRDAGTQKLIQDMEKERVALGEKERRLAALLDTATPEAPTRPPATMLDLASDDYDPDQYQRLNARFVEWQDQNTSLTAERDRIESENQADYQQRLQTWRQEEAVKLKAVLPEFFEDESLKPALLNYLTKAGMTPEELELMDSRLLPLAHKAFLWDQAQKGVKPRNRTKTLKPGARTDESAVSRQKDVKEKLDKLNQSGSKDDALAVMRARRQPASVQ